MLPVRIVIEASRGESVKDAYVALVPPDKPWSRPAAEKIGSGATVILEVPEGVYRVVAGVRGKGVKITDPLRISASRRNEVRVALPAMRTVTGTVRDEGGQPLPDRTVGEVNAFVEAPLGRASELAARYFAADWRTKSAADGSWSLLLPEGADAPTIVAESPGYAPAWRAGKEGPSGPVALVMRRGAGLRISLDREAPELVVTLTAKGESASVPAGWQAQFWARRAVKSAVEWASLPAGEYDIHAQQWDPRTFGRSAKLGTVALERGATRELRLELPRSQAVSKSVASVVVLPAARFDPATIKAFGRDAGGAPRSMPRVLEQVSGGTLLHLDTSGLRPPYFGTTSDFRFVVLPVHEDGRASYAAVLDRGGASFQLQTASDGLPLPASGMATFHGCPGPEEVTVPLGVSKSGKVAFAAPAGCTSFVVDLEPFAPMVFPRGLAIGDPEWLGELTLYASGSAAIRVAAEDGSALAGAVVSISARTDEGAHLSVPVAEKAAGPDGWARFDRLPAGPELAVSARTSDGDRSVIEHIHAGPAQQRIIDPLKVPTPATVIVEPTLDPGFLEQFPGAHLETLFLEPVDGRAPRRSENAEEAERIEFRRVLPGRWQVGAIVTTGNGYQPILGEQIEVKAGQSKTVKALFQPLVFRGRVSGNIQDLAGNIDILSSSRADAVPSVEVSPSGEFVAVLPRRGLYFVGVRPRSTGQMIWAGNTPFADPALPVEVRLPQGVVVARLRAGGRPLAGATVMARMQHQPTTDVPLIALPVKSGAGGEARIEGLLPGQWVVFVSDGGEGQKSVTVSGTEAVHADLEVTAGLAITGSVTQTFGAPVAGAKVTCLLPSPDGVPSMRVAFTRGDGWFDLEGRVASRATVLCSVTSFSGAQGYRVVAGQPARLVLPADSATLRVTSLPEMDRFSGLWLVSRDGRVIEVSPYVPRLPGAVPLTIPALAPEAWKLVRVSTPAEWMALAMGGGALTGIVDVTLKPDEQKTVDLKSAGRKTAPAV